MMNQDNLFPKITVQLIDNPQAKDEMFLFNSETRRGFSIDGLAVHLCKKFTGEKSLVNVIQEFRAEQKLKGDEFQKEIDSLLADLTKNNLVTFFESPQTPTKES